jgi:type 1 fimbriae regulatory protein FimB
VTPDYLTEQELEDLLKKALEGRYGVRDALIISLAYHHCMRVSEVIELKLCDVENGRIRINRKKGSNSNEQPLQSAVGKPWLDEKKLLNRYLAWRKNHRNAASDLLFVGQEGHLTRQQVYNIVHDAAIAAGIVASKARTHILKHSGISHLVQRGMPLIHVRDYAGHKDFRSTLFYAGVSSEQVNKAASAAFARL